MILNAQRCAHYYGKFAGIKLLFWLNILESNYVSNMNDVHWKQGHFSSKKHKTDVLKTLL